MLLDESEIILQPNGLNEKLLEGVRSYEGYDIPELPKEVTAFCSEIRNLGGRAFLVGGCVRDVVFNGKAKTNTNTNDVIEGLEEHKDKVSSKDFDLEIFGINPVALEKLVRDTFGNVDLVGKEFGILKSNFPGLVEPLDIATPRTEKKTGVGYTGFETIPDPYMTMKDAARRRDVSMNCMYFDPLDKKVYDPFEGVAAMNKKEIDITDEKTFIEDPVRVLRVAQFAARFGYQVSARTKQLCTQMISEGMLEPVLPKPGGKTKEQEGVTRERISTEFEKLLTKGKPSVGIEFLAEIGYFEKYFKFKDEFGIEHKFTDLKNVEQDTLYHQEGNVWIHTMECLDAGVEIIKKSPTRDLIIEGRTFVNVAQFVTDKDFSVMYKGVLTAAEKDKEKIRNWAIESVLISNGFNDLKKGFEEVLKEKIDIERASRIKFNNDLEKEYRDIHKIELPLNKRRSVDESDIKSIATDLLYKEWYYPKVNAIFNTFVQENSISNIEAYLDPFIATQKEAYLIKYSAIGRKKLERDMKMSAMLGIMLHDIGKLTTTKNESGNITSYGHEKNGVPYAKSLLDMFDYSVVSEKTRNIVPLLIEYHMAPILLFKNYKDEKPKSITKVITSIVENKGNAWLLAITTEADQLGRQKNADGSYKYLTRTDPRIQNPTMAEMYEMLGTIGQEIESKPDNTNFNLLNGEEIKAALDIKVGGSYIKFIQKLISLAEDTSTLSTKAEAVTFSKQMYSVFLPIVIKYAKDNNLDINGAWKYFYTLENPLSQLT